jgi:hypothetical protein
VSKINIGIDRKVMRWEEISVDCDMKLKEVNRHHTYSKNKNIWGSEEIPLRDKER